MLSAPAFRSPKRRAPVLVAASLAALLAVSSCGASGSQRSRFVHNLRQLGLSSSEASCVGDHLYGSLTRSEIRQLYSAAAVGSGNAAAIPLELRRKLYSAVVPCAPATSGSSTTSGSAPRSS